KILKAIGHKSTPSEKADQQKAFKSNLDVFVDKIEGLISGGDFQSARDLANSFILQNPNSCEANYYAGFSKYNLAIQNGNQMLYHDSSENFRTNCLNKSCNGTVLRRSLAYLAHIHNEILQSGKYLDILDEIKSHRPQNLNILNAYSLHLIKIGDFKRALVKLHETRKLDPHNFLANILIGLMYQKLGNFSSCYKAFYKIFINMNSQTNDSWLSTHQYLDSSCKSVINCLVNLGNLNLASEYLRKCQVLDILPQSTNIESLRDYKFTLNYFDFI
ncbi:MAG: hypothetical protein MHMPM18_001996, partial [Marteilia pararefringens]